MIADSTRRLPPRRPPMGDGLLRLGWGHFWLFSGILGGMIALLLLAFIAHLSSI